MIRSLVMTAAIDPARTSSSIGATAVFFWSAASA